MSKIGLVIQDLHKIRKHTDEERMRLEASPVGAKCRVSSIIVILLGVVLCTSLLQIAEATGAQPETAETTGAQPETAETTGAQPGTAETTGAQPGTAETTGAQPGTAETTEIKLDKIPVPDNGFTIVLYSPMNKHLQLEKVYKVDGGNTKEVIKEVIPGLTVWLPRDTPVFFMIDKVDPNCSSVEITVKDEKSTKSIAGTRDTKIRFLKDEIKYICVITPKKGKEGADELKPQEFKVTLKGTKAELYGTKATLGAFLTDLKDENYVNIKNKIVLGSRDQLDRSFGVLVHAPIYAHNFEKFRFAFALSSGLTLGKLTTSDESLSIGSVPTTLGVSFLFAGLKTDSLLSISVGGILKPVKRLNGYSVGDEFPSDPDLTKSVNRSGWFGAVTFSYDIFDKLGFKSASPSQD